MSEESNKSASSDFPAILVPLMVLVLFAVMVPRYPGGSSLSPKEEADIKEKVDADYLRGKIDVQRKLQAYVNANRCKKTDFYPQSKFVSGNELLDSPSHDVYRCSDGDYQSISHWEEQDRIWHNREKK